jgi:Beta-lactamase
VPNAAASLLTTAGQYALFTAQVLDSPPPGPAALSPESRASMLTPHTTVQGPLAWGLGFALEDRGDSRYVWHWGNNGDFHSFVIGDVTAGSTLVVLTNATGGPSVYEAVVRDAVGFDPASLDWI